MQQQVQDYIEFLLEKRLKKPRGKPTFEWAGALKDLRDQYTSVELQHRISDWRIQVWETDSRLKAEAIPT